MAAYFFSSSVDVDIILEGEEVRKQIESKAEKDRPVSSSVYYDGESVSGQVRLLVLLLGLFSFFISVGLKTRAGYSSRS
jgi:Vacuolar protein sorting-associated protein 26